MGAMLVGKDQRKGSPARAPASCLRRRRRRWAPATGGCPAHGPSRRAAVAARAPCRPACPRPRPAMRSPMSRLTSRLARPGARRAERRQVPQRGGAAADDGGRTTWSAARPRPRHARASARRPGRARSSAGRRFRWPAPISHGDPAEPTTRWRHLFHALPAFLETTGQMYGQREALHFAPVLFLTAPRHPCCASLSHRHHRRGLPLRERLRPGHPALAQAIEKEGFRGAGRDQLRRPEPVRQQQSRASAFILSIDDEEFTPAPSSTRRC